MKSEVHDVPALPRSPDQRTNTQRTLEGLVNLNGILQDLRVHLSMTVSVWKDFSRVDGHISFFSDMTAEDANIALERIKESFEQLKLLEQKLSLLYKECTKAASVVSQLLHPCACSDGYF